MWIMCGGYWWLGSICWSWLLVSKGVVRNEGSVLMFILVISSLCSSRLLLVLMWVGRGMLMCLLGFCNG